MPSYIGGYIALLNCFFENLPSMVFTPPSVPLLGDRNPQGREDVTALRCSEPLRSKVGGAPKSSPDCAGWDRLGKLYFFTLIIIGFLKLWN